MLGLMQTEIYGSKGVINGLHSAIKDAMALQLTRNIGVIAPNQMEPEMLQLKVSAKNKSNSLLSEAIALYEGNGGKIRLFDLSINESGSPITRHFPFIPAKAPISSADKTLQPVVFVNLFTLGEWNADNTVYSDIAPQTDLRASLEGGLIAYKLQMGGVDRLFNNHIILETLTKIYTNLFSKVILKLMQTGYGVDNFKEDLAKFNIANFFVKYCVQKKNDDVINRTAYVAIKSKTPLNTILEYNENLRIDFTSLSSFLKTFGLEFFKDDINISEFSRTWMQQYGSGTLFAIEYIPYLIFYLFAAMLGAPLGGSSKLTLRRKELEQDGLGKLYLTIISEMR